MDIDGVMLPAKSWQKPELLQDGFPVFASGAVQVLQEILTEADTIVLTTSHRSRFNVEQWKSIFRNRGIEVSKLLCTHSNTQLRSRREEVEIKMTEDEHEYKTTVVKRRYTNLDVLCDDLDLAKIQRPVFKGICQECASDVDAIITNKNWSSLEKNYQLKQCYMMRDKRLRETLDEDQYRKFLRIKDADEYLVLTHDPELKDGVNN